MEKFSQLILKSRWLIIGGVVLITFFFIFQLFQLKVDSDIVNALPADDPDVSLFKEVGKTFGSNEIGMVIIEAENVLMPEVLEDIKMLSDSIAAMNGISSVTSLTHIQHLEVTGDDFKVTNLIDRNNLPRTRQEAEILLKKITADPMITGNLIAGDGKSAVVMFSFDGEGNYQKVAHNLLEKVKNLPVKHRYYLAGGPFMVEYVSRVVKHDLTILIPVSFLIITLLLYLSFHSFRGVVLPLLTAALAIIWSMGMLSVLGMKLSMVSNNVPIIILAVGTAYAIHILNQVDHWSHLDKNAAIKKALSLMIVPVSLSALTTMVGFLSFIFGAYLSMIRDFGLLAALGTFFSGFLALTFIPALLSVLPPKKRTKNQRENKTPPLIKRFLIPLSQKVLNNPKRVLTGWMLIFLISIGGIFLLKRSVSVAGYFKKQHPVSQSERILSSSYGGTKPVFITFSGDVQDPEMLKSMMDLENYLNASPLIGSTQSIADVIRELNRKISNENAVPDDEAVVGQLWFLLDEQENIKHLVNDSRDKALIIAKFQDIGARSTLDLEDYLNDYLKKHPDDRYNIRVTGMPFINKKLADHLLKSQIVSLIIALILVITIVSLMLKSFIKGLYATLPVIVTIGIIYGIMGYTGIPLNIATVLVASIAIGIGIDYSIHFFSYFDHLHRTGKSISESVKSSMLVSGKGITINFISVALGFISLIFSNFVPMIYFGLIIAISMFGAAMGALTLLPAILLLEQNKNNK